MKVHLGKVISMVFLALGVNGSVTAVDNPQHELNYSERHYNNNWFDDNNRGFSEQRLPRNSGNVYSMTNSPIGNEVVMYGRNLRGNLRHLGYVATEGLGAGDNAPADPLGSQGSIIVGNDSRNVYAVNAGSNTLSVFSIRGRNGRLRLEQVVDTQGDFPVSIAQEDGLLYVLNAGGEGSIMGYSVDKIGRLIPIEDSRRSLGLANPAMPAGDQVPLTPGQVVFDSLQRRLIITNAGGRPLVEEDPEILIFTLNAAGIPSEEFEINASEGAVPFDMVVTEHGSLLVVEGEGSLSSYNFIGDSILSTVSASIANNQTAVCWIASNGEEFAFTIATASGTISAYEFDRNGQLGLLNETAVTLAEGALPIDTALTEDGSLMYTLDNATGDIHVLRVSDYGGLTLQSSIGGLPNFDDDGVSAQGIAVR